LYQVGQKGNQVKQSNERRNKFLFRHYRSGNWCPYQGVIRTADDANEARVSLPDELTGHLRDGDEFELVIRRTGRKVTTRIELEAPNHYGRTNKPKSKGCPRCQKMEADNKPPQGENHA
jgi:hypothetical protein